jgi:hypothetical protein
MECWEGVRELREQDEPQKGTAFYFLFASQRKNIILFRINYLGLYFFQKRTTLLTLLLCFIIKDEVQPSMIEGMTEGDVVPLKLSMIYYHLNQEKTKSALKKYF